MIPGAKFLGLFGLSAHALLVMENCCGRASLALRRE